MHDSLPFVKNVVEECSLFFYTLHRFCNNYADKLNKRLGTRSNIDFRRKSEDMLKLSRTNLNSVKTVPRSPYIMYLQEQTKLLKKKQEFVNYDAKKMSKYISKKWRHLEPDEKQQYTDKWQQLQSLNNTVQHHSDENHEEHSNKSNNEDNTEENLKNHKKTNYKTKDNDDPKEPTIQLFKGSDSESSKSKRISKKKQKTKNGKLTGFDRKSMGFSIAKSFMENFDIPGFNMSSIGRSGNKE